MNLPVLLVIATLLCGCAAWHLNVVGGKIPSRLYSVSTKDTSIQSKQDKAKSVPITLLSGFLGTGKTTTLRHLLENTQGSRIGVIVNDVASVNIDAKLVTSQSLDNGIVELQNGCACCSLADELFFSVDKILEGRNLDAIVVELSGVADPSAIQKNWLLAPDFVKDKAIMSRVVIVVDASTFGTDFLTLEEARQRKGWVTSPLETSGQRKISELLAQQVEAADVILLNKIDLANEQELQVAQTVVEALNPKADLKTIEYGTVSPDVVLGDLTAIAEPSHSHSQSHDHAASEACNDADCDDQSHHDSHSHAASSCNDPECNDESHSHSHSHSHAASSCNDPDCTDTSHSHSHSHATSTDQLGISNFVFKATRPFHPDRLAQVLNRWPVPVKDTLDFDFLQSASAYTENEDSPFVGVLRSKGFCWVAPNSWTGQNQDAWRHDIKVIWSHAGKSFGLKSSGKWWDAVGKEEVKKYFVANMALYDKIVAEDFVTEEFGDRRNELVFIGTNLDEKKIRDTLESCLYSEEELEEYRRQLRNYQEVKTIS